MILFWDYMISLLLVQIQKGMPRNRYIQYNLEIRMSRIKDIPATRMLIWIPTSFCKANKDILATWIYLYEFPNILISQKWSKGAGKSLNLKRLLSESIIMIILILNKLNWFNDSRLPLIKMFLKNKSPNSYQTSIVI